MMCRLRKAWRSIIWAAMAVLISGGCASLPEPEAVTRVQNEADLVAGFQSWKAIWFIKPDVTGAIGSMRFRQKTFTREGFVKLLNNLKLRRELVVVVLDRGYEPDPYVAHGGMDAIEKFFRDLGFQRIVFRDGAEWNGRAGSPILRDTGATK